MHHKRVKKRNNVEQGYGIWQTFRKLQIFTSKSDQIPISGGLIQFESELDM